MKIFIIDVAPRFMPSSQGIRFPKHNDDYGIEQDFMNYLAANQKIVTTDPGEADWFYLPVYWTRWNLNNDYGRLNKDILLSGIDGLEYPKDRTFTVCQYADGPGIPLEGVHVFLASRTTDTGLDVPLLCKPHNLNSSCIQRLASKFKLIPVPTVEKKYKASFRGRFSTHSIRRLLADELQTRSDILFAEKSVPTKAFTRELLQSEIALCPRGHGGDSFRFYEAMQLGVVPLLIGDIDTRPFKSQIDWGKCSFYAGSVDEVKFILNAYPREDLRKMGEKAQYIYASKLQFGKWCNLLINELIQIKRELN
jgi:hypothetical protein